MQLSAKPGAPDDSREQINFIKATENSIFTVTIRLILKLVNLWSDPILAALIIFSYVIPRVSCGDGLPIEK